MSISPKLGSPGRSGFRIIVERIAKDNRWSANWLNDAVSFHFSAGAGRTRPYCFWHVSKDMADVARLAKVRNLGGH
jgi:hypothetical protein